MDQHVMWERLLKVAYKETRLTALEFDHFEKCSECLVVYAKHIPQIARARAKNKRKQAVNLNGSK